MIPGSPLGDWGVGGSGWVVVRGCTQPMCTHVHMTSQGIPRDSSNGGSHLHEIIMFTMRVCVCMCMHVHMWGGHQTTIPTPQPPPPPNHPHPHSPTPPTPRAAGSPKHQNSISLELIEIILFCLKILYL